MRITIPRRARGAPEGERDPLHPPTRRRAVRGQNPPGVRAALKRGAWAALAGLFVQALGPAPSAGQEVPDSLTLPQALEIALGNNPGLLSTRNDASVADWNVRSAYGSLLPSVSAGSGFSWQGPGEQRFGSITAGQLGFSDQPSYLSSSYNVAVSLSLSGATLMAPGQARRDREAVRAQLRAAEASLRLAVTRAYLEAMRQEEGRALAKQELARAELNLRLATGRRDVGSATMIDVQQGEVGVGRAEIALLQAETGVRNATIRLLEQMGVAIGAKPALTTEFAVSEFEWSADELFERALAQNPDLAALRAREQSALYGVRMARSSYYPSLTLSTGLSGFAQSASSTDAQEAAAKASGEAAVRNCEYQNEVLRRLVDPLPTADCSKFKVSEADLEAIRERNRAFPFDFTGTPPSASLTISIPVFQGLGRQRGVEAARALLHDNRLLIRQRELALRADIESRLATVRTAYRSALIEKRNQALASEQLRLAQERYRNQLLNFVGLVEAETVKAQADRQRVLSIFTYHDAIADLESVVGAPLRNP